MIHLIVDTLVDIYSLLSSFAILFFQFSLCDYLFIYHEFRSSRDTNSQRANAKAEPVRVNPILPPPPAPKKPIFTDAGMIDYLSGDAYKTEASHEQSEPTSYAVPLHSSPTNPASTAATLSSSPPYSPSTPSRILSKQPVYDEPPPINKSSESLPLSPLETQSPGFLLPPPSSYNQRQQFFEQQGVPHSSSGFSYADDSLLAQTQNLSLNSSTPTKQEKTEDVLFKDLVDFAKSKTSSSSKPSRPFWEIWFVLLTVVQLMNVFHQVLLLVTETTHFMVVFNNIRLWFVHACTWFNQYVAAYIHVYCSYWMFARFFNNIGLHQNFFNFHFLLFNGKFEFGKAKQGIYLFMAYE